MKITLNGTKVRAYKGVDKQGRPYQFIVVGGRTNEKTARVIFNNRGLYGAVASAATSILDSIEVEASAPREHKFEGRDGKTVTTVEAVDPMPTGIERSTFPTKYPWPTWETLMESAEAPAPATGSGADSEADSEAEF